MKLKDPFRKKQIFLQKEEVIRQRFLQMLLDFGFPKSYIQVEVGFSKVVSLPKKNLPNRRLDIVCYGKKSSAIFPILLVECKAVKITPKEFNQLIGYNLLVKAPYIALVSDKAFFLGKWDSTIEDYQFTDQMVPYSALLESIH
jgi:hypothetical protein